MNTRKKTALHRLRELHTKAASLVYSYRENATLKEWQMSVETALSVIFGTDSHYLQEFRDVSWSPFVIYSGMSNGEWSQSFYAGRDRSKAIIASAISAAEDYEVGQRSTIPRKQAADSSHSPDSLTGIAARELSALPRSVRIVTIVVIGVGAIAYALWSNSPDTWKQQVLTSLSSKEERALTGTPATWVSQSSPALTLDGQVVVAEKNASDGTVDMHISCESPDTWHRIRLGEQYRFVYRKHTYVLTVLQFSAGSVKIAVAPVL